MTSDTWADLGVLFPPLGALQIAGDWWDKERQKIRHDPVWGERIKKMENAPIVKWGLEPALPWTNAVGRGLGTTINDIANTFDKKPGYQDYAQVNERMMPYASSGEELAGSAVRFLAPWSTGFGALTAAGLPILAAAPLAAGGAEYALNPYEENVGPLAESLPPQWLDKPIVRDFVRRPEDTEHERRVKQGMGGLLTGLLIDAPTLGMAAAPGTALGLGAYMGVPMASNAMAKPRYDVVSDDVLRTLADYYNDPGAIDELNRRTPPWLLDESQSRSGYHPRMPLAEYAQLFDGPGDRYADQ